MWRAMTNCLRKADPKAAACMLPPNKQLQRTVTRRRGRAARAAISLCTCVALDTWSRGR
jgi:hypothetical protein